MRNRPLESVISELKKKRKLTCELHNLDKAYFCLNFGCEEALCPDCYHSGAHKDHPKRHLKAVYHEKKAEVDKAMVRLSDQIEKFQS